MEASRKHILLAACAGVGLTYAIHSLLRSRRRSAGKQLPMPEPCHPFLKHIPLMAERVGKRKEHIDQVLVDLMREQPSLGKVFRMKLVAMDLIVVCDAEAAKEIMVQKNYPKSHTYSSLHPFIGEQSMVCSQGKVWAKQFARGKEAHQSSLKCSPHAEEGILTWLPVCGKSNAYWNRFLKDLVPTFVTKTELLLDRCGKRVVKLEEIQFASSADTGRVLSLHNEIILLTMDVICQVALSVNFGFLTSKEPPEIYHLFMELLNQTAELARSPHLSWRRWLPWEAWYLNSIQSRFDAQIIRVITHRLDTTSTADPADCPKPAKSTGSRDILELALKTAKEGAEEDGGGKGLDLQDVLAQVKTFLFAGHDTTASTAAFALYEISLNPEVEAKLTEEIDRVCGNKPPSSDNLGDLKYTGCVIKETLRMWPPGGTARIAPEGSTLQGYDISNTPIYIPHYPIHRDTDYFGQDAGVFRPERWQDESAIHPSAYMPFSKGSRDCIGQTFAIMEAKVVLAMLYSRFTFKYTASQPESQAYRITSYPKNGVPMTIHTRKK